MIAGTGKVIKKLTNRNKNITESNDKIDRFIDKIASGFRARSGKTQEFFDIERTNIGERSADAVKAKKISRELDLAIDKIFPPFRNIANRVNQKKRDALLKDVNDLLLSGDAQIDDLGYAKFGALDQTKKVFPSTRGVIAIPLHSTLSPAHLLSPSTSSSLSL